MFVEAGCWEDGKIRRPLMFTASDGGAIYDIGITYIAQKIFATWDEIAQRRSEPQYKTKRWRALVSRLGFRLEFMVRSESKDTRNYRNFYVFGPQTRPSLERISKSKGEVQII